MSAVGEGWIRAGGNNEPWRICFFKCISEASLWDTSPPPTMTDNSPGKLPIRKDNHLQVFRGAEGLGSCGRRLWNKSGGNKAGSGLGDAPERPICVPGGAAPTSPKSQLEARNDCLSTRDI